MLGQSYNALGVSRRGTAKMENSPFPCGYTCGSAASQTQDQIEGFDGDLVK